MSAHVLRLPRPSPQDISVATRHHKLSAYSMHCAASYIVRTNVRVQAPIEGQSCDIVSRAES